MNFDLRKESFEKAMLKSIEQNKYKLSKSRWLDESDDDETNDFTELVDDEEIMRFTMQLLEGINFPICNVFSYYHLSG